MEAHRDQALLLQLAAKRYRKQHISGVMHGEEVGRWLDCGLACHWKRRITQISKPGLDDEASPRSYAEDSTSFDTGSVNYTSETREDFDDAD
jgi:hypothetical protein